MSAAPAAGSGVVRSVEVPTYQVTIFIAGDIRVAKYELRKVCDRMGLCVTVEPTDYIYTGGSETGIRVGLINYGRFPAEPRDIFDRAQGIARLLIIKLKQESASVVGSDRTVWLSKRVADVENFTICCDAAVDSLGESHPCWSETLGKHVTIPDSER